MRIMLTVAALALAAFPGFADDRATGAALDQALRADSWTAARALVAPTGDPIATAIVDWEHLRDGSGSWQSYLAFLRAYPDWPGLRGLRAAAERAAPAGASRAEMELVLGGQPPQTGTGALRYAAALGGRAGQDVIARAWRELSLSAEEEAQIRARYAEVIAPHHIARLDMLGWEGLTGQAERMLGSVPAAYQALGRARIGLRRRVGGVDALIRAVPANLVGDPGLNYERYLWRLRADRRADATNLLLQMPAAGLGRADLWAGRRMGFAHSLYRQGQISQAYTIASQHGLSSGADFAELEWFAGFLALTRMGDPVRARAHFRNHQGAVTTPISLGRAGYWIGRAEEAAGNAGAARSAYRQGAQWQTSFYGQLAAERGGVRADRALTGAEGLPDWRRARGLQTTPVRAAQLLSYANQIGRMRWFATHVAETARRRDVAALGGMALDLGRPQVAVRLAKTYARRSDVIMPIYYPLTGLERTITGVEPAFALAVTRQESEFDTTAVSGAGARGMMQLMPGTARTVAPRIGEGYSLARLNSDPAYNVRLGTRYLAEMLARYDGSMILAAAAYNAGPGRVDQWLGQYGDPRGGVDPIVWIETIPFSETRNYVMRVLESTMVYRARLSGRAEHGLSAAIGTR